MNFNCNYIAIKLKKRAYPNKNTGAGKKYLY